MNRTDPERHPSLPVISRSAHAKINLALHVTGQRGDGYHLLDTLVVFAEMGDQISLIPGEDHAETLTLDVCGPFADGLPLDDSNLVMQAASKLAKACNVNGIDIPPAQIVLEKNLPVASGIGGGSADAAATLLALKDYWQADVDLFSIAESLGADVAMCLHSKPLRAWGVGDKISPLKMAEPFNLLLVNPMVPVSTPEIFGRLEQKDNSPIELTDTVQFPPAASISCMRNDLQEPAIQSLPAIRDCLHAIDKTGSRLARMSGSGATCIGIYDTPDEVDMAKAEIKRNHPGWWTVATRTTV